MLSEVSSLWIIRTILAKILLTTCNVFHIQLDPSSELRIHHKTRSRSIVAFIRPWDGGGTLAPDDSTRHRLPDEDGFYHITLLPIRFFCWESHTLPAKTKIGRKRFDKSHIHQEGGDVRHQLGWGVQPSFQGLLEAAMLRDLVVLHISSADGSSWI